MIKGFSTLTGLICYKVFINGAWSLYILRGIRLDQNCSFHGHLIVRLGIKMCTYIKFLNDQNVCYLYSAVKYKILTVFLIFGDLYNLKELYMYLLLHTSFLREYPSLKAFD